MKLKKMIRDIGNPNLNLQERLFRLIMLIGLAGLLVGFAAGLLLGESMGNGIAISVAFVALAAITYFSVRYNRTQWGAVITAALLIYLILPYNFLTTGGIYGGAPIWFLLGVVYVCLVVVGKVKYFLLVSGYILFAVCYYVAYTYPSLIVQHTTQMAYVDSIMTLMIVSGLTCGMILFQNTIFRSENALAKKQKKEIEELNQMQNRFFSSMSHEIRTPINTIIGLNEMILREDVSDEVAADAKNIQGASKMLLTLINDILDMSKIESGNMDIVAVNYDVGAMLSDIVNMIWVRAREKGLEFHIDVDQSMPSQLCGDEVRIKQILINVLNNAVKYTSEGSVTLSISCKKMEDGCAQISYSVTDTGMGIKKENIPYLFSAFKRGDEEKNRYIEGTGLGLSIVKQLVELMDGEIAVNSVYTKGSTFVITLPQKIVGEGAIGELNLEAGRSGNTRTRYKQSFEAPEANVLIVDDNEANLMVEKKLLKGTRVTIDTAESGAQCLKKTLKKRYNVIFMDHLMPQMDGVECLHEIRRQTGGLNLNTPVVILTANAGGENQALYKREGFDGYLLKPVSSQLLEQELLRHLPREMVNILESGESVGVVETPVVEHRKRLSVMISTESMCDLPKDILEKYQIAVIPYRIVTEGGTFLDGIEMETDGLLSYIVEKGKTAYSEEPEVSDYETYFAEQLTKAQYIIHVAMAKHSCRVYERATEAARAFDNVLVIDSGQLSGGLGLMVLYAAEASAHGKNAEEIVRELNGLRSRVKTSFIVSDTEYMAKAGRIPRSVNSICKAFMIHPVIALKKSNMKVGALWIGTKEHAWRKYLNSVFHVRGQIDDKLLIVSYAGLTAEELSEVLKQVEKRMTFQQVICQKASPAEASNCGPGVFGLQIVMK